MFIVHFHFCTFQEGPIAPIKNKSVYNLDMKIQGIAYGVKQIGIYFKVAIKELLNELGPNTLRY